MKEYKVNMKVVFEADEFDGKTKMNATITEVHDDYAIAKTEDGITLWIDEDTDYQFTIVESNEESNETEDSAEESRNSVEENKENKNMEKILNKIKNLLDLANNNPNENEAIAAALKAQELMAKYNIELDQLDEKPETREIVKEIYHQSGRHEMRKWKLGLAAIIANNFRCKMYVMGNQKDVVFYGFKEDAKIALQVFTFLYEVGNKFAVRYYNKCKKEGKDTRGVMNTYLKGFRDGVAEVLEKQCTALMIVTPKEVTESYEEMTKGWSTCKSTLRTKNDDAAYNNGKRDGKDIATARNIEG